MRAAVLLLALAGAAGAAGAASPPEVTRAEQLALQRIVAALEARDCELAVSRVNAGLAEKYTTVFLTAGTMFEDGICLKPNWDRAQQLYLRAAEAGHRKGYYKLVAGMAHRGRDLAAALWWAQREQVFGLPAACVVPETVHREPESYATALRAWPPGRAQACAYTVGVMALLAGDLEYPAKASAYAMEGTVSVRFVPAQDRFEWRTEELDAKAMTGVVSSYDVLERDRLAARDVFRKELQQAGERALKRFEKPASIDADWAVEGRYVFVLR